MAAAQILYEAVPGDDAAIILLRVLIGPAPTRTLTPPSPWPSSVLALVDELADRQQRQPVLGRSALELLVRARPTPPT